MLSNKKELPEIISVYAMRVGCVISNYFNFFKLASQMMLQGQMWEILYFIFGNTSKWVWNSTSKSLNILVEKPVIQKVLTRSFPSGNYYENKRLPVCNIIRKKLKYNFILVIKNPILCQIF